MNLKKLKQLVKQEKEFVFLEELLTENEIQDKEKLALKYYAKLKLKSILEIAKTGSELSDSETLSLLVNLWFEWRSEWIRYNAINNYNMVIHGTVDLTSVIKSSYVSYLISKIEDFIPEETLQKIHEIMVEQQYQVE